MVTDDPLSKPQKGEEEIGRSFTQRIVNSDQFYTKHYTPSRREFFIFSEIGDFVKGILLGGARDNSHINRTKSYQIEAREIRQHGQDLAVIDGQVEEFFANRQLQRFFTRDKLAGKCIRIIYIGRVKSGWGGHSAKIYRVFIDKGIFQESEEEVYGPRKRKTKKRKSTALNTGR